MKEQQTTNEAVFTKAQLLASKTLGVHKDVLMAVLDDDKEYTKGEVQKLIRGYLSKEV